MVNPRKTFSQSPYLGHGKPERDHISPVRANVEHYERELGTYGSTRDGQQQESISASCIFASVATLKSQFPIYFAFSLVENCVNPKGGTLARISKFFAENKGTSNFFCASRVQ